MISKIRGIGSVRSNAAIRCVSSRFRRSGIEFGLPHTDGQARTGRSQDMQGLLEGKRIVVTGASRGLGRAFAVGLAEQGARLVINGTNPDKLAETQALIEAGGGVAVSHLGSVAEIDVCDAMMDLCVSTYGGIDTLVNNAGVTHDRTLMRMSADEFDDVIAVNLRGTWACSKAAALAMKADGGHIINVISGSAFTGPIGQTNYAAAKAGVASMTRCWSFELERYGIRANAMWPLALTDMTEVIVERNAELAEKEGRPAPAPMDLGLGSPEQVARMMVFLASDAASELNGQIVSFNGQKMALWTHPKEVNITQREDWSLDEIVAEFHETAGRELQPIYKAVKRV
jgi:NAD(P)-dependent dehydrogenase (short-subunit alcohol dehydrogenase family)